MGSEEIFWYMPHIHWSQRSQQIHSSTSKVSSLYNIPSHTLHRSALLESSAATVSRVFWALLPCTLYLLHCLSNVPIPRKLTSQISTNSPPPPVLFPTYFLERIGGNTLIGGINMIVLCSIFSIHHFCQFFFYHWIEKQSSHGQALKHLKSSGIKVFF